MKPPNESGGARKDTAATEKPSQAKPDSSEETVNALEMARSVDEAIATYRRAAKDPVEFQRLGLWLRQMRRALP